MILILETGIPPSLAGLEGAWNHPIICVFYVYDCSCYIDSTISAIHCIIFSCFVSMIKYTI